MYNITDFLLVQLSFSKKCMIKSCLSELHSFINLIIRTSDVIIILVIIRKQICNRPSFFRLIFLAAIVASRNFFGGQKFGGYG